MPCMYHGDHVAIKKERLHPASATLTKRTLTSAPKRKWEKFRSSQRVSYEMNGLILKKFEQINIWGSDFPAKKHPRFGQSGLFSRLLINGSYGFGIHPKGQLKPKADWRAIDSLKNWRNQFGFFFARTVRKYLKLEILISSFKYLQTVKQKKMVRLLFGRIYGAPICLRFYLTFRIRYRYANHAPVFFPRIFVWIMGVYK